MASHGVDLNKMSSLLLVLRSNIVPDSDVRLAEAEVQALCSSDTALKHIRSESALRTWLSSQSASLISAERDVLERTPKREGVCAFVVEGATFSDFVAVIDRAAFIQEAMLIAPHGLTTTRHRLIRTRLSHAGYVAVGIPLAAVLEYSALLVFRRERVGVVSAALDCLVDWLLDGTPPPSHIASHLVDAVGAKKTTLYLSHELHLYKGKFFPRLVHSLINRFGPPKGGILCDPFAGSGTALLEGSLLGLRSVGLDVDPTAVLISSQKMTLASINPVELADVYESMQAAVEGGDRVSLFAWNRYTAADWRTHLVPVPEPMRSRLQKRGGEEGYDLLGEIEEDAATALVLISQTPAHLQPLFRVCLSHALTKKLRLRFVGIGNGRFTFDVARVRVLELFIKKAGHMLAIAEAFDWVRRGGTTLGPVQVHRRSATRLGEVCAAGSVDLLLTSPPYIPASSGREHYARARAIPLVLTGAASLDELEEIDKEFIGEMSGQAEDHFETDMPPSVMRTLEFLRDDEQRRPKFRPTLQYYADMRTVLDQAATSLSPDGVALIVVAKSHTFYIHKSKEILHTVDAVGAMSEIAALAGLQVSSVIDVPLHKSGGLNARPRSTDGYSEAVLVLKRAVAPRSERPVADTKRRKTARSMQ